MGAPAALGRTSAANAFLFCLEEVCGGQIGLALREPVPLVYPGMVQAPSYQPAMIPAQMPMMPAMGTVPTMPGEAGLRELGAKLSGLKVWGRVLLGDQMVPRTKRFQSGHGTYLRWTSAVLYSHDGATPATASDAQLGLKAAGSTAAKLHQPAGDDSGRNHGRAVGLPGACGHGGGASPGSYWACLSFSQGPADDHPGHEPVPGAAESEAPAPSSGLRGHLPASTLNHCQEASCPPREARE